MKKKWISLLLALVLCLGLASPAMAAEAQTVKAYTCDKILWIGPIPVAGLTVINEEYYVPLESLRNSTAQCCPPLYCTQKYNSSDYLLYYNLYSIWTDGKTGAVQPVMCTLPGLELGTVTPSSLKVEFDDRTRTRTLKDVVFTGTDLYELAGHYPMLRLKVLEPYLGYREDETGIHIGENPTNGENPIVTWEDDLAGQAAKPLRVPDTKATLLAFHDYLVNNMTHEQFMDSAYFQKNDPKRHERDTEMWAKYDVIANAKLATGYGKCQDYAELFQSMCLRAGIPCEIVSSLAMAHAWNRVFLWGQWYHVDVTFDDPGPTPTLKHTYFLVSAEKMAKDHVWVGTDYSKPTA